MIKSRNEILNIVESFADQAHGLQVRKYTGEPYIAHPKRVMEMTREYQNNLGVQAAALLHDVLEDTPVTSYDMEQALLLVMNSQQVSNVLKMVVELTDIFLVETYPRLNRKQRKEKEAERLSIISPEAQTIKYADIMDNVKDIVSNDINFARIYVGEASLMLNCMKSGNSRLRERALNLVEQCFKSMQREPAFF